MKAQKGGGVVEVYLYFFFNLDVGWRWVVNATPGRFIHGKETVHCTEGWVGALGPGLDGCGKCRL